MKKSFSGGNPGPGALWLLLAVVGIGVLYLFWFNSANREVEVLTYTKLLKEMDNKKIASIIVQDQYVQGKYVNNKTFSAYIAPTEMFWSTIKANNVDAEVYPAEKHSWGMYLFLSLLPFLILLIFFYFRQNQNNSGGGGAGKIFSVGKSKAKFFSPNTISVTFKDVAGVVEAKEDLRDIIEFLKNPQKFERLGAKIPRGILLSGAPGNGKTLLAKAVAGESSRPFFSISGSDFVEVFVGVGASRVRDLFAQAKKHSPCIIFIDEIDAVGRQRGIGLGGGNDEREQTLNQLLSEMDGFSTEAGAIIVLAATNRPDVLDKALLRPGRFDRIIEVPYPDLVSREEILNVHSKNVKLDPEVNLSKIARGTPGFSGADLENLINEAALLASKTGLLTVKIEQIEIARDKLMLGAERKTLIVSEKDKRMTAYHESGHTLLNVLLPSSDPLHKVTIVPRGRALGVSWSLPEMDKYSRSRSELEAKIVICMGGLISEKLIFNEQTTGASNDIEQATDIARSMVCRYGMSDLGPIDLNSIEEHPYLGRDIQKHKDFSESTAQKIDTEISKIIDGCLKKGQELLITNKDRLDLLATTLFDKETLYAKEVYELLNIEPREMHAFRPND
ncbi:MAG: ATP-dependent zinc metalloprotease FtsH [candidate division TM6 bacterium GW2011_GWF2_37_49]|nr:MAG: ATP-dependent zinc metalloprotease FtsH [candidate division TM6 bacterium GW2011_GWF2_37_49]